MFQLHRTFYTDSPRRISGLDTKLSLKSSARCRDVFSICRRIQNSRYEIDLQMQGALAGETTYTSLVRGSLVTFCFILTMFLVFTNHRQHTGTSVCFDQNQAYGLQQSTPHTKIHKLPIPLSAPSICEKISSDWRTIVDVEGEACITMYVADHRPMRPVVGRRIVISPPSITLVYIVKTDDGYSHYHPIYLTSSRSLPDLLSDDPTCNPYCHPQIQALIFVWAVGYEVVKHGKHRCEI
jgi:hypothetical protein